MPDIAPATPVWRHLGFYEAQSLGQPADLSSASALNELSVLCSFQADLPALRSDTFNGGAEDEDALEAAAAAGQSSAAPATYTLLADISGRVRLLDAQYRLIGSWLAYASASSRARITHIACDIKGRVVTLGEEDGVRFPLMRVWDLTRATRDADKASFRPLLLTEGKVQHGSQPHPVASLATTLTLSYLSIGLADGTVLLMRSLDAVLSSIPANAPIPTAAEDAIPPHLIALPKFKVVFQPNAAGSRGAEAAGIEPITGLGFAESPAVPAPQAEETDVKGKAAANGDGRLGRNGRKAGRGALAAALQPPVTATPASVNLFIVTLSRVLRYTVAGPGAGSAPATLDDVGCALGCASIVPTFVARPVTTRSRSGRRQAQTALSALPMRAALAGKMVVSREEAIYVVGADGREVCLAYEGPKASTILSSTHLIMLSPPLSPSEAAGTPVIRYAAPSGNKGGASPFSASPAVGAARGAAGTPQRSSPNLALPADLARRGSLGGNGRGASSEAIKITVFDLDSKLVAFTGLFEGRIRQVWTGSAGEVLVLSDDGTLTRLNEKPLRQKLEVLFRKSLFLLAVNVAKSHAARSTMSEAQARETFEPLLGDIFCRYGDHLYARGDYDGAVAQYVKTIGTSQPSHIIRKFLDAQRINNLTTYLQELHARGLANSDHTTLLLNCYTKLKDVAALDRFIKRPLAARKEGRFDDDADEVGDDDEEREAADKGELPFDLDTAIRVCRQAGYLSHASYLARRFAQHDEYLRIQLEDAQDYDDALAYLRGLAVSEVEHYLKVYGRTFLDRMPEATTDFLIEVCSGSFRPTPVAVGSGVKAAESKSAAAAYLSYLQVGRGKKGDAKDGPATPSSGRKGQSDAPPKNAGRGARPYVVDGADVGAGDDAAGGDGQEAVETTPEEPQVIPSPRHFLAHFIRHPAQLMRFLESVALARWGQSIDLEAEPTGDAAGRGAAFADLDAPPEYEDEDGRDQRSTWNTLLELYLALSRAPVESASEAATMTRSNSTSFVDQLKLDGAQRSSLRAKAQKLLEQHDELPYDVTQALVLCTVEGFHEGMVWLYERLGMFEDVLRFWMDLATATAVDDSDVSAEEASANVMHHLRRYGKTQAHLYPMVLRFLVSNEQIASRHRSDITEVLDHIERHALMSPLEVVQTLSRRSVASVGLVKDYITRAIEAEKGEIEANQSLITSYRTETAKKLTEMAELSDASAPRVFQMTRCTACGGSLDLPSVHFMCKHSYHQRCLAENEAECPTCARAHGVVREIRRNNEALGENHEVFLQDVDEAEDGFETIAQMFSKGLFARRTPGV